MAARGAVAVAGALAALALAGCINLAPSERVALEVSAAWDLRRLTATPLEREAQPAVSADGRVVAFTRFTDAGSTVHALDLATGAITLLSAHPDGRDHAPTVSADGRVVAWVSVADGDSDVVAGGDARDVDPSISPDGTLVAFVSTHWGNPEVVVARTDGSGERRLTTNRVPEFQPTFSRDGQRLAYIGYPEEGEVYVVNVDGTGARRLTENAVSDIFPDLDERGDRVAFVAGRDGAREVFLLDLQGELRQLTSNRWDEWSPRVTSDGSLVVFRSEGARGATEHLVMAVRADGTGLAQLARGQDFGMSADGRAIVLVAEHDLWLLTRRAGSGSG